MSLLKDYLEPEATLLVSTAESMIAVSQAISLKRIADTLEKVANTNSAQLADFVIDAIKRMEPTLRQLDD